MVLPPCVIASPPGVRVWEPTTKPVTDGPGRPVVDGRGFTGDLEALSVTAASGRGGAFCWSFFGGPDEPPVADGEATVC